MTSLAAKALRMASVGLCLLAALSFVLFALDQAGTASGQQQQALGPSASTTTAATPVQGSPGEGSSQPSHEHGFRKGLDEAAGELTSPVAGLAPSSEWLERCVRLLFALVVYGFGLGYLARAVRVRT